MRVVLEEAKAQLRLDLKETDLFKVLQTGDLVTVDRANPELVPKIPNLLRLRAAIYSPEFREMVQRMTGCAPLTDRIDCSANVYPRSGHLLCHDDVIGTRCISYIVYLTDPDDGWDEVDGGALELYPVESPGHPRWTPPSACSRSGTLWGSSPCSPAGASTPCRRCSRTASRASPSRDGTTRRRRPRAASARR